MHTLHLLAYRGVGEHTVARGGTEVSLRDIQCGMRGAGDCLHQLLQHHNDSIL